MPGAASPSLVSLDCRHLRGDCHSGEGLLRHFLLPRGHPYFRRVWAFGLAAAISVEGQVTKQSNRLVLCKILKISRFVCLFLAAGFSSRSTWEGGLPSRLVGQALSLTRRGACWSSRFSTGSFQYPERDGNSAQIRAFRNFR